MWAGAARRCGSAVPLEACECEDELMTTEAGRVPSTVTTRGMAMTWWGSKAGDACAGSLDSEHGCERRGLRRLMCIFILGWGRPIEG